jgi:hypothetical protein
MTNIKYTVDTYLHINTVIGIKLSYKTIEIEILSKITVHSHTRLAYYWTYILHATLELPEPMFFPSVSNFEPANSRWSSSYIFKCPAGHAKNLFCLGVAPITNDGNESGIAPYTIESKRYPA